MQSNTTIHRFRVPNPFVIYFTLLITAVIVSTSCSEKKATVAPPPPEVQVIDVSQKDVPVFEEWVAQLNGPVNAEITPKVQGYLLKQNYHNGTFVNKGQLLFELDPRQYEAAVDQAKAESAKAQANLERFQNDVVRDTPLAAQNAIPQKQLDNDIANVNAGKAQVQAAKAALQNAQLNLTWTKVFSPISGLAGDAKSQVGDLVSSTTKMTTISQVNPIWASFNISESAYLSVANRIADALRTGRNGRVPIEYIQANAKVYPHTGKIIQVNREITAGTGTIQFTAEFPNAGGILRPGGFGRVRMKTAENKSALLVPQIAVVEVQSQYQVLVVSPENKASFRPVKMGQRVGPNWIVTDGLQPGERVIAEGILRVQQAAAAAPQTAQTGIPVSPKPYAALVSEKTGSD